MRKGLVVVGGQVVARVERAGARARYERARARAHARVSAPLRALVVRALDELVAVVRDVVLRAAAREGGQVEARLANGAGEAGRVGAADHLALRVQGAAGAQHEGERARVVVARDGRVDAARQRAVRVQVGQHGARVGAPLGAAGLVEAEVAQVAAAGAARARAARRRRRVLLRLEHERGAGARGARGARGRGRVDVALRELVLEPLGGLVEAGGLLGEHEVRVGAKGRGVCGGARGSGCAGVCVSERVRVRVGAGVCVRAGGGVRLTWRARARRTRRRSGSARAATVLRSYPARRRLQ